MAITEIASGIGGQLLCLPEVTYGVAPTLTSPICWEYNTEGLELKKTTVQGRGLHAGGRFDRGKRRVVTNYEAGGPIDMDLPSRNLNTLLKACMGSADTSVYGSNGTLGSNSDSTYTAVHIPGSNIGYSLCIQKSAPTVDGVIEPFTYVGCKITEWGVSVASNQLAKFTATIDARNELGGPVITTPAVPLTTVTATNSTSASVQVVITGGTLTAVKVNTVTVGTTAGTYTVPAGGTISITYSSAPTWAWSGESLNSDPLNVTYPALATWTNTSMDVFHFRDATLLTGGTASTTSHITSVSGASSNTNVTSASFKVMNPVASKRFNLGSSGFKLEQVDNGFRQITGSLEVEWLSSEAMYAAFSLDTPTALQLNFQGNAIGTGSNYETFNVLIPYIKLDGESPKVGSPDIVKQKVNFSGLDDETNNQIQVTYTTLDTV